MTFNHFRLAAVAGIGFSVLQMKGELTFYKWQEPMSTKYGISLNGNAAVPIASAFNSSSGNIIGRHGTSAWDIHLKNIWKNAKDLPPGFISPEKVKYHTFYMLRNIKGTCKWQEAGCFGHFKQHVLCIRKVIFWGRRQKKGKPVKKNFFLYLIVSISSP